MKKKVFGTILAVLAVSGAWFAPQALANISSQDVEKIVRQEYPGATIQKIERDYDDGRQVYEVDFQTDSIWDGDLTIDAKTGQILERDIDNDRHCHGGHHGNHYHH